MWKLARDIADMVCGSFPGISSNKGLAKCVDSHVIVFEPSTIAHDEHVCASTWCRAQTLAGLILWGEPVPESVADSDALRLTEDSSRVVLRYSCTTTSALGDRWHYALV